MGQIFIYLDGQRSDSTTNKYNYKYDTLTDTYSLLPTYNDKAFGNSQNNVVLRETEEGADICILGSSADGNKIKIMTAIPKDYTEDHAIVLAQNYEYKYTTELIDTDIIHGLKYEFNDVFYYTRQDGFDNTIPTYYGDGINWIKFKN